MLSSEERRIWDDVQRHWTEDAAEPPGHASRRGERSRDTGDLPVAVVAGAWITVLLFLAGVPLAGVAVAVATAVGWALWHFWPQLNREEPSSGPLPVDEARRRRPADGGRHEH